ncbi:MAG: NAD(P)/FAD-dependent oxidoreductase [Actinomycetota bacterium]|nr:NAD(P)/FAD-dependent oxidoreductase [Actinomycetota bacterium]
MPEVPHTKAAVIGAGFAGIGASIVLGKAGVDHVVLERADEIGGTWRDNGYPGCRCDVPSHLYSYSFALNPEWSETYSGHDEIWEYLRRVVDEFGVAQRILFNHDVLDAAWDDERQRWRLSTSAGERTADILVMGTGPLAEPSFPDIPGIETFQGTAFHSAKWPADHDVTGERVAVIGTGASAVQIVPEIQPKVERLTVFQRTAPWVLPHTNRRITDFERAVYRNFPPAQRVARGFVYCSREVVGGMLVNNGRGLRVAEKLAYRWLERQVPDPELRAKVTPDYRPGCKRLLPTNDWYPAIQQPNVDLVTEKIIEIGPRHIVTADGAEVEVDTIVFATGFHVTDNPALHRIRGRDGRSLAEHWADTGMRAYLGTTVDGFPNMFFLAGPNTGIGHTSLVFMIEAQLAYLAGAVKEMRRRGAASIEVRKPVLDAYAAEIQRKAARTVWNTGGCASWYLDAEDRNTTIWPDYTFRFKRRTRRFDPESYVFKRRGPVVSGA